jgi:hypothetical protein
MLLVELATQGVRGFSGQSRAVFRTGYNVASAPPGAPAGLVPLLSALLYGGDPDDDRLSAGDAPAKAGLTVAGRDGRTYRIVRQIGSTAAALHRLEPSNSWAVLAQDGEEIRRIVLEALGLPATRAHFEGLFCLTAAAMPSRGRALEPQGAVPPAVGSAPQAPSRASTLRPTALVESALAASRQSHETASARERAARLREEVLRGKQLEEMQFQLDGLSQQVDRCDKALGTVTRLVAEIQAARAALTGGLTLEALGLPADSLARAARYDDARRRLEEVAARLAAESEKARSEVFEVPPLQKDRGFLFGIMGGAVSFSLGMGDLQRARALSRRGDVAREREASLRQSFEAEYAAIKEALKISGVGSGEELVERFQRQAQDEARAREAEAQLVAARSDPVLVRANEERERLIAEGRALEQQIAQLGAGVSGTWRELERELEVLEKEIAAGRGAPRVGRAGGAGSFASSLGTVASEDPTPRLVAIAQEVFGSAADAVAAALRERAGQYLLALSDQRYTGLDIDSKGNSAACGPGRAVPAAQLDERDLDLVYLSVKLTLAEKLAPVGKITLVLDDPFVGMDEGRLHLLSRMLKHIASITQVVHVTSSPLHRGLADAVVAL